MDGFTNLMVVMIFFFLLCFEKKIYTFSCMTRDMFKIKKEVWATFLCFHVNLRLPPHSSHISCSYLLDLDSHLFGSLLFDLQLFGSHLHFPFWLNEANVRNHILWSKTVPNNIHRPNLILHTIYDEHEFLLFQLF